MTETKKGTGDRQWIYDQIYEFMGRLSPWDQRNGSGPAPKRDLEIYTVFAPLSGGSLQQRDSWRWKNRTIKRQMIESAINRLIKDGKIRVHSEEDLELKSMHGNTRRDINTRKRTMGRQFDGKARTYIRTNVLQAMADALADADG